MAAFCLVSDSYHLWTVCVQTRISSEHYSLTYETGTTIDFTLIPCEV